LCAALFECRVIDEQRAESEEHRASVRRRRSVSEDSDEESTDGIVGMYASYSEVRHATTCITRTIGAETGGGLGHPHFLQSGGLGPDLQNILGKIVSLA